MDPAAAASTCHASLLSLTPQDAVRCPQACAGCTALFHRDALATDWGDAAKELQCAMCQVAQRVPRDGGSEDDARHPQLILRMVLQSLLCGDFEGYWGAMQGLACAVTDDPASARLLLQVAEEEHALVRRSVASVAVGAEELFDGALDEATYARLRGVIMLNTMRLGDFGAAHTTLFRTASMLNHDCHANVAVRFPTAAGCAEFVALRDVHVDEELTLDYVYGVSGEARRQRLHAYGIACDCSLCVAGRQAAQK